MEQIIHSVTLDSELCKGCTTCVKRCPMEAIRVRDKKAIIIKERCIDCGECIRVCPNHAKKAVVDTMEILKDFKYTIALPAPTLYGQFKGITDRNYILTALKRIGFDDVFEVSSAAEVISAMTHRELIKAGAALPIISTACPTVLRIIRVRFPSLIPHLLEFRSPMEFSARWAKNLAQKMTGLPKEDIGCIFISPCPAKATCTKNSIGSKRSVVDAVIAISEVYPKLRTAMKNIDVPEDLARANNIGIGWAISGGESTGAGRFDYLSADGMENVIHILEALENEDLPRVDFIELNACVGGCVGGVLTAENPYIAKGRIQRLMKSEAPVLLPDGCPIDDIRWDIKIEFDPVLRLDPDISVAIDKLAQIKKLEEHFCGMDCGACGAPSCRALAEDIVKGKATEDQCIFIVREKLQNLLDSSSGNTGADKGDNQP